jgi:uncharacterized protein (TIGR04222 family)
MLQFVVVPSHRQQGQVRSRVVLLLAILAAFVLPLVAVRPAVAKSVEWARYDVALTVRTDGSYHVVERQEIAFQGGPFSGAFAEIPLSHIDGLGNVQLIEETADGDEPYQFVSASQYEEDPGTYTAQTVSGFADIEWGFTETTNETRTFRLEYDVVGALRVYPQADPPNEQIWWTAVSEDVTSVAPVREATMTITLPQPVDPAQTVVTPGDSPEDVTDDGQVWTWQMSDLDEGDSFEVRLQIPMIIQTAPPMWQQADDAQRQRVEEQEERGDVLNLIFIAIGLLLGIVGGLGVYGLWYARGRDPHTGLVADFLPQPPDDLPPGVAGALLDEEANEADVVATLIDLGRREVITIKEVESPGVLGFGGGRDFELALKQENPTLLPFERDLLQALFGRDLTAGKTTMLSSVKGRFDQAQTQIKENLYDELVKRQYFTTPPQQTRSRWRSGGWIALVAAILGGLVLIGAFAGIAVLVFIPIIVLVALALTIVFLSRAMPRKTTLGAEAAAKWRSFRKYLDSIEKYEQLDEATGIFDRFLPYAIAFGLERSWVQKFASVDAPAPAWYDGDFGGFGGWVDIDPRTGRRSRRRYGPGPIFGPLGESGNGGERRGGDGGGGGIDFPNLPDLQDSSDRAGRSLQSASDGFFSLLGSAAKVFGDFSSSGGGGRRGGSWGGRSRGGFSGGGSRGGSSGGGRRGFH